MATLFTQNQIVNNFNLTTAFSIYIIINIDFIRLISIYILQKKKQINKKYWNIYTYLHTSRSRRDETKCPMGIIHNYLPYDDARILCILFAERPALLLLSSIYVYILSKTSSICYIIYDLYLCSIRYITLWYFCCPLHSSQRFIFAHAQHSSILAVKVRSISIRTAAHSFTNVIV